MLSLMTGSVIDEHLVQTPLDRNLTGEEQLEIYAQRIGMAAAIAFLMGLIMVKTPFSSNWTFIVEY